VEDLPVIIAEQKYYTDSEWVRIGHFDPNHSDGNIYELCVVDGMFPAKIIKNCKWRKPTQDEFEYHYVRRSDAIQTLNIDYEEYNLDQNACYNKYAYEGWYKNWGMAFIVGDEFATHYRLTHDGQDPLETAKDNAW